MYLDAMIQAVQDEMRLTESVRREAFEGLGIDKMGAKKEIEPVTIADYGSQAILCRAVQAHYPDDAVFAEESGEQFQLLVAADQQAYITQLVSTALGVTVTVQQIIEWLDYGKGRTAPRHWLFDPIDGTRGFVAGRHYAVGIALIEGKNVTGSIIGCPGYGTSVIEPYADNGAIFYAWEGKAYRVPTNGGIPEQVHVSSRTDPAEVVLLQSVERAHGDKSRKAQSYLHAGYANSHLHELDSMEKYALVASGGADVVLHIPNKPSTFNTWDHAPGQALLEAAGGRVTNLDGAALDMTHGAAIPDCKGLIISNGALHEKFVAAVQKAMEEAN